MSRGSRLDPIEPFVGGGLTGRSTDEILSHLRPNVKKTEWEMREAALAERERRLREKILDFGQRVKDAKLTQSAAEAKLQAKDSEVRECEHACQEVETLLWFARETNNRLIRVLEQQAEYMKGMVKDLRERQQSEFVKWAALGVSVRELEERHEELLREAGVELTQSADDSAGASLAGASST